MSAFSAAEFLNEAYNPQSRINYRIKKQQKKISFLPSSQFPKANQAINSFNENFIIYVDRIIDAFCDCMARCPRCPHS